MARSKRERFERDVESQIFTHLSLLLCDDAKGGRLPMRKDGYVAMKDILTHPQLRGIDAFMLQKVIREDRKKRFKLMYKLLLAPGSLSRTEMWWVRANQEHAVRCLALHAVDSDLTEIYNADRVKMVVHGTTMSAWESIKKQGLSRMDRNYIHLAEGLTSADVISGMSSSSEILIFINLQKALAAGIKFYLSSNRVVLTPGNERGFLEWQFFQRVERVTVKKTMVLPPVDSQYRLQEQPETTTDPALITTKGGTTPNPP
ncbi:hypothetical protein L208DRAFT_1243941 [Tricholoma matsutake]|nr:hypothetical protein L208DRAFT_1243941 [Tricholoma matsutake 945]